MEIQSCIIPHPKILEVAKVVTFLLTNLQLEECTWPLFKSSVNVQKLKDFSAESLPSERVKSAVDYVKEKGMNDGNYSMTVQSISLAVSDLVTWLTDVLPLT